MFEKLICFLYPKTCIFCNKKISENLTYACEKCSNIIKYSMNEGINLHFLDKSFDKLISPFLYGGIIRNKILEFKFNNKPFLGKLFAKIIVEYLNEKYIHADVVIPVPMYYKRQLKKGYNQSAILAKEISKRLGIKYKSNALIKIKQSAVQSTLDLSKRMQNVLGTYGVRNIKKIYGKKVILIDDVYTTGATVNECSKVLKSNGAREVIVITIAHGKFD